MTLSPVLQDLLARLPPEDRLDLGPLLQAIDAVRYSGTVTLHMLNGRPRQVDLGASVRPNGHSVRLSIVEGERPPLDTDQPPRTP